MCLKSTQDLVYDSSRLRLPLVEDIVELLRYRDLLFNLVRRDLTVRYKRSSLGLLWTMLNPLLTMVVMTIVFSYFFRFNVERYPVYVLSGMVVWIFFSQSTSQAMHALVWGGGLSNKIFVPKAAFVVSAVLGGLINLFLALVPLALIMLVLGQPLSPSVLFLPVSILIVLLFALGVGLIVAALAVFFADMIDLYQFILSVLMYLTPIYYPSSIVPPGFSFLLRLNPIYYFVEIFRLPIYQGILPEPYLLLPAMLISMRTLLVGWWFFTSKSDEFAYRT